MNTSVNSQMLALYSFSNGNLCIRVFPGKRFAHKVYPVVVHSFVEEPSSSMD